MICFTLQLFHIPQTWSHFRINALYILGYGFILRFISKACMRVYIMGIKRFLFTDSNTCMPLQSIKTSCKHSMHVYIRYVYSVLISLSSIVHRPRHNKVHGANMGSTWVLSAPDGPHVGPMNLTIRGCLWKVLLRSSRGINCLWRGSSSLCLVGDRRSEALLC